MSVKAVYTSLALGHHVGQLAVTQDRLRAVQPARDAFLAEFPGAEFYGYDGAISAVYLPGDVDMTVWRKATGRNAWSKFQPRAKGGEAMAERLRSMSAPERTLFSGMPEYAGLFSKPGYRLLGTMEAPQAIWLSWSVSPEEVEQSPKFDGSQWKRMKVSDYYVMLEEVGEA